MVLTYWWQAKWLLLYLMNHWWNKLVNHTRKAVLILNIKLLKNSLTGKVWYKTLIYTNLTTGIIFKLIQYNHYYIYFHMFILCKALKNIANKELSQLKKRNIYTCHLYIYFLKKERNKTSNYCLLQEIIKSITIIHKLSRWIYPGTNLKKKKNNKK